MTASSKWIVVRNVHSETVFVDKHVQRKMYEESLDFEVIGPDLEDRETARKTARKLNE